MTRPACVEINLAAAKSNLNIVRSKLTHQKIMAIIKANAYGHGLARMAHALNAAQAFGVAFLEEAYILRHAGINSPIILLEGAFEMSELKDISQLGIDIVVHHDDQITMLEHTRCNPINVWLKIDTGMHRLGFDPGYVAVAWQRLKACPQVSPNIRLMTHFASAQERGHASVFEQLNCFSKITETYQAEHCLANSAALLNYPESLGDWVRPGLMLYGVSPFTHGSAAEEGLRPVMTVRSRIIAVKQVRRGESVGYGGTWQCPEDMTIGIVAMGYGDGYPRHAESGTPILVNGQRAALIGKASMDMLTVDLRKAPNAQVGDPVVLWGEGLPIEEIARYAGTIPYELMCGVPLRARFSEISED